MKVSQVLMSACYAIWAGLIWGYSSDAAGDHTAPAEIALHIALAISAWLSIVHLCEAAIAAVREPQGDAE